MNTVTVETSERLKEREKMSEGEIREALYNILTGDTGFLSGMMGAPEKRNVPQTRSELINAHMSKVRQSEVMTAGRKSTTDSVGKQPSASLPAFSVSE